MEHLATHLEEDIFVLLPVLDFNLLQVLVLRDELVFLEEAQLPDQVEKLEVLLLIVQVLVQRVRFVLEQDLVEALRVVYLVASLIHVERERHVLQERFLASLVLPEFQFLHLFIEVKRLVNGRVPLQEVMIVHVLKEVFGQDRDHHGKYQSRRGGGLK